MGLRANPNRAEIVKLHLMAAARLKWAPATIARVDNWVPVRPFDKTAIYRRPICISRLVTLEPVDGSQFPPCDFAREYSLPESKQLKRWWFES